MDDLWRGQAKEGATQSLFVPRFHPSRSRHQNRCIICRNTAYKISNEQGEYLRVGMDSTTAASVVIYAAIASAECPAVGYKVDLPVWYSLVERLAPGRAPKDFGPGGEYAKIGGRVYSVIYKNFENWGASVWCSHALEMARQKFPKEAAQMIEIRPAAPKRVLP